MTTTRFADDDADLLLRRAAGGDAAAARELLERHRGRLTRMVELRLGPRLASRIDASEVVGEALAEAEGKLPDYVRATPMPFYPWLHRLAAERLATARRRQMPTEAGEGSGVEEDTLVAGVGSTRLLNALRAEDDTTPGRANILKEGRHRARAALESLEPPDREILIMHYLEELDFPDVAAILGVDESAAKMRHLRALRRMRSLLEVREPGAHDGRP
jgi:RNA polymerase sigma-70 factor (ECF subfamily)